MFVAATGQKIDNGQLDALCEYYLPRVFQYVRYWVDTIETAEDISLRVLKNAIGKIDSLGTKTESVSIKVFSLARESVNLYARPKAAILSSLTSEEREVISLKLGAELTNRGIAAVLRIGEPRVGEILYRSFSKLKDAKLN
jgi:DNA-directed RNA polymerase specialized sigma24 family protein